MAKIPIWCSIACPHIATLGHGVLSWIVLLKLGKHPYPASTPSLLNEFSKTTFILRCLHACLSTYFFLCASAGQIGTSVNCVWRICKLFIGLLPKCYIVWGTPIQTLSLQRERGLLYYYQSVYQSSVKLSSGAENTWTNQLQLSHTRGFNCWKKWQDGGSRNLLRRAVGMPLTHPWIQMQCLDIKHININFIHLMRILLNYPWKQAQIGRIEEKKESWARTKDAEEEVDRNEGAMKWNEKQEKEMGNVSQARKRRLAVANLLIFTVSSWTHVCKKQHLCVRETILKPTASVEQLWYATAKYLVQVHIAPMSVDMVCTTATSPGPVCPPSTVVSIFPVPIAPNATIHASIPVTICATLCTATDGVTNWHTLYGTFATVCTFRAHWYLPICSNGLHRKIGEFCLWGKKSRLLMLASSFIAMHNVQFDLLCLSLNHSHQAREQRGLKQQWWDADNSPAF